MQLKTIKTFFIQILKSMPLSIGMELIFVDIVAIEALTNQRTKQTKQQVDNQNMNS